MERQRSADSKRGVGARQRGSGRDRQRWTDRGIGKKRNGYMDRGMGRERQGL